MGYESYHTLEVYKAEPQPGRPGRMALGERCSDETVHNLAEEIYDQFGYSFDEWEKWYDCLEDMSKFSKRYPEYIFKVHGEGENAAEDQWDAYFWKGKFQECVVIITYPPYNPENLVAWNSKKNPHLKWKKLFGEKKNPHLKWKKVFGE